MQNLGKAKISLNGDLHASQNGSVLMLGNNPRTTTIADHGIAGYTEGVGEPGINATFIANANLDLEKLANFKDGTVTWEGDDGSTWVLRGAWVANAIEVTASEGSPVPVEFRGLSLERVS